MKINERTKLNLLMTLFVVFSLMALIGAIHQLIFEEYMESAMFTVYMLYAVRQYGWYRQVYIGLDKK